MFPSIKAGGAKIREGALKERPREGERETPGKHIHFRLIVRQCCQSCYDTRTQVHTQAYMQKHMHNICSSAALWFGRTLESHPTQTHKVIAHTHTHTQTIPLTWESSRACGTQIKTITTSPAELVVHVTEATGSHCLQGDMIQKACGREGNESIVGGNSRIADIKNAPSVGLMFVYENRRWCEQSFQIGGLRGQLYQLPSEFQHHPESVHPTPRTKILL